MVVFVGVDVRCEASISEGSKREELLVLVLGVVIGIEGDTYSEDRCVDERSTAGEPSFRRGSKACCKASKSFWLSFISHSVGLICWDPDP